MSDQSNSAAERSAHVTRGEKPAPAEWPVVRMPDGTWKLKSVVALEARIAELEAALRQIIGTLDDPTGGQHVADMRAASTIAIAALEGGKKDG